MSVAIAIALAGALCYAGMTAICLSMDRHHTQVRGRKSPALQRLLRPAGWALLVLALWPCVGAWGSSVGVVIWFGFLSAGALALVLLLPYQPKGAAWLMGLGLVGGLPLLLLSTN